MAGPMGAGRWTMTLPTHAAQSHSHEQMDGMSVCRTTFPAVRWYIVSAASWTAERAARKSRADESAAGDSQNCR